MAVRPVSAGSGAPRLRQRLRGVLLQVPQPVEGRRLGVEPPVGLGAAGDDLVQHPAPGRVVLRVRVVELLAQPEGGGQLALGVLHGRDEGPGRLLAELGRGEAEFLLAGADRVVGLHQQGPGLGVQLRQRGAGPGPFGPARPAGAVPRRAAPARGLALAAGVRVRRERAGRADRDHREHEVPGPVRAAAAPPGSAGPGVMAGAGTGCPPSTAL